MKREECLLVIMAALLLTSFLVPGYSYSPPAAEFVERNFPVYEGRPVRSAYVECALHTRSYYHHVVDWMLSYPHDDGLSRPGYFRTVIVVDDWESFVKELPYNCEILGVNDLNQSNPLYSAALRLRNLTAGTDDYVKLGPFFTYAEYGNQPNGNWTRVHVVVFTTNAREPVKLPFLAVWAGVITLSLFGVLLHFREDKLVLAGFLTLLLLGTIFVGGYLKVEHGIEGKERIFEELLALNSTDKGCGMSVAGVTADFKSIEDVSWFLTTLKRGNSSVGSVRWEDYSIRIRILVPPDDYKNLLNEFKGRGWEVSPVEINYSLPYDEVKEINGTIQTLLKYLPSLSGDERRAVEEYITGLNETIHQDMGREQNPCVEVFSTAPDALIVDYAGYSNFLAKFALIIICVTLVLIRRR